MKKRYAKEHGSILKADSKTFFLFPLEWGGKEFFMKKNIVALGTTALMTLAMAVPAFAANLTGPFFYMSSVQSDSTAAPAHAQNCVEKVTDETIDGIEYVVVHTQEITSPVPGEISGISYEGMDFEPCDDGFMIMKDLVKDNMTDDGLIPVSVTITMSGHPVDLSNIYLDIEEN